MKRIYIIWLYLVTFFIFIIFTIPASAANLRPLVTIDACALPKGQVELRLGGSYIKDRWFPFEGHDTDRREADLPSIDLMIGLTDDIEVDFSYSAIYRESERFSWDYDSGDLSIMGKARLWKETPDIPNITLAVCTKLPNSDYDERFGTDEFDFFSLLLLSKYVKGVSLFANGGLGILGNPKEENDQDDAFVYAVGLGYPLNKNLILLVDVSGWAASDNGKNNYSRVTTGLQWQVGSFRLDFGARVGLNEKSEDWGVITGATYILNLF